MKLLLHLPMHISQNRKGYQIIIKLIWSEELRQCYLREPIVIHLYQVVNIHSHEGHCMQSLFLSLLMVMPSHRVLCNNDHEVCYGRKDGGDFILFVYLQELIDSEINKNHHNLKHIIISHTVTLCCLLITLMAIMCHSMFYPHIIVTTI